MTRLTFETIAEIVQHVEPTWAVESATVATPCAHVVRQVREHRGWYAAIGGPRPL